MNFLLNWLINAVAVMVAASLISGIHYQTGIDLMLAALFLGILNAVLKPILKLLSLPLMLATLGLFTLVINAWLLLIIGRLLTPHFRVDTFGAAFWGALIISVVSLILSVLTGMKKSKVTFRQNTSPPPPASKPPEGKGPIIDV